MMSNTRTVSAKETTIKMSDTETASDTETMSEGEIPRAKNVQVGGRGVQMTDSLDDVGI